MPHTHLCSGNRFQMASYQQGVLCVVLVVTQRMYWKFAGIVPTFMADRNQLIYYTRLTARTSHLLAVEIVAGLLVLTWIMCLFAFFLECRPLSLYWEVLPAAPQCAVCYLLKHLSLCADTV